MFDLQPPDARVPLPQSQGFMRAMKLLGTDMRRLDFAGGSAVLQTRRMRIFGTIGLVSRGPLWSDAQDLDAFAQCLCSLGHPVILNAENTPGTALRKAGFFPLMTPATIACLTLGPELENRMHQKWRNRLRRAETAPLKVTREALTADADHWLLTAESAQRRQKSYRALPTAFATAFARANPHMAQVFTARLDRSPVAAMLFLRHGRMCSYFMGHTTPAGRALNAHNLLLARAAIWLADHGADMLDLGTLDTVNAPGLARFKLGTGATAKTLGGTWLYHSKLALLARHL